MRLASQPSVHQSSLGEVGVRRDQKLRTAAQVSAHTAGLIFRGGGPVFAVACSALFVSKLKIKCVFSRRRILRHNFSYPQLTGGYTACPMSLQINVPKPESRPRCVTRTQLMATPANSSDAPANQEENVQEEKEPAWKTKLRCACSDGHYDTVARIALSLGSGDHAEEMLRILAQELVELPPQYFRRILKAMRLRDAPTDIAVKLYNLIELWLREQLPNIHEWNGVLYALVLDGRIDEGIDLLLALEAGLDERLPEPNSSTYCILMPAVAERHGTACAARLLARMSMRDLSPDPICYLMMTTVCSSVSPPDIDRAKLYFRKGDQLMALQFQDSRLRIMYRRSYFYNTLMAAYIRLDRLKESLTLLGSMRSREVEPDAVTFCILQHSFRYNIDGVKEVRHLFRMMELMSIVPDAANYNVLIRSYSYAGQVTEALQVANRMREAGLLWDEWTYLHLINAVIASGQVEQALRLLAKMRKDGIRPKANHYICTFAGLANAGFYEDASRVFHRLISIDGSTSHFAYNTMMGIHCRRGNMADALELFSNMESAGLLPNIMSYRVLLEGYSMQTEWESALELQMPLEKLRARLQKISKDANATAAARAAAEEELHQDTNWTKAYYVLIDAAVWNGDWMRGVQLLEDLLIMGYPINPDKHFRLLKDMKSSNRYVGSGLTKQPSTSRSWSNVSEFEKIQLRADERWSAIPNATLGLRARSSVVSNMANSDEISKQQQRSGFKLNVLSASLSPSWFGGSGVNTGLKITDLCKHFLATGHFIDSSLENLNTYAHEILYWYYHATVHRRSMVPVLLSPRRVLIGRAVPESLEALQTLFLSMGDPSSPAAPLYVFMRPTSADLDALLTLLMFSAGYPDSVILLRSKNPDSDSALAMECRERSLKALGFSLASTLATLPAAVLANSRLLITNNNDMMTTTCEDFEDALRDSLVEQRVDAELAKDTGEEDDEYDDEQDDVSQEMSMPSPRSRSSAAAWARWLRRQDLDQLLRSDGCQLRLDSVMHRPVVSDGEQFRVKPIAKNQVSVDLEFRESDEPLSLNAA